MVFFNDLGKRLSQAGQTAVQKTKDMTDIARINGLISDEEKAINNNYYEIGKLYVEMHQNDFENDFAGIIATIRESEAKIKNYHQQIQSIKGVVRCEKCGAEVASTSAFCNSCGTAIPKQPEVSLDNDDLIKCTGCEAMIDKNMRFCTSCGKATENQIVVETVTNKCPNCSVEVSDGVAFCTECGTKIN